MYATSCLVASGWRVTSTPLISTVARAGRDEVEEQVDGGGLARAVGAEQAVDVARADVEVEAVERDSSCRTAW